MMACSRFLDDEFLRKKYDYDRHQDKEGKWKGELEFYSDPLL